MSEQEIRVGAIKRIAADRLETQLEKLHQVPEDEEALKQYEIDFLGDLYARMIVSVFMGYRPDRLAKDAEDSAYKLFEIAKEHDDDAD